MPKKNTEQHAVSERIPWHPAFYAAAEFDLRKYKDVLTFEQEHQLSKEPLRIDLLIIKKASGAVIKNEIGRFFKGYNIIEYKSPGDALTVDDFYKTMGYACLFKAMAGKTDAISADDITVSLFRESYPRKLTKALNRMGINVVKTAAGIYHLDGQIQFPAQIVVTKELSPETGLSMRVLSKNLQFQDLESFFKAAEDAADSGDIHNINAILHVAERANNKVFHQTMEEMTMTDFLEELIKDRIEEREAKSEARGRAEGKAEGKAEGEAIGRDYCAKLMGILLKAGRIDDALRAASDKAYLNQLIDEMVVKKHLN